MIIQQPFLLHITLSVALLSWRWTSVSIRYWHFDKLRLLWQQAQNSGLVWAEVKISLCSKWELLSCSYWWILQESSQWNSRWNRELWSSWQGKTSSRYLLLLSAFSYRRMISNLFLQSRLWGTNSSQWSFPQRSCNQPFIALVSRLSCWRSATQGFNSMCHCLCLKAFII